MACPCRCHAYGAGTHVTCDTGPEIPGGQSCTTLHDNDIPLEEACVLGHAGGAVERFLGLVCRQHYHRIADTLRQIEELYALLPDVLEPGNTTPADSALRHWVSTGMSTLTSGSRVDAGAARRGTNGGSKRAHAPAPGRLEAMGVTDRRDPASPLATLERVFRVVLIEMRWPDADAWSRLARRQTHVVGILHALHDQRREIAARSWVGHYLAVLEDVHRALATAVGTSMWPVSIGTCPNCQAKLYPKPTGGVDEVTCRKCSTTWRGVHLARLRLIHEQEASA